MNFSYHPGLMIYFAYGWRHSVHGDELGEKGRLIDEPAVVTADMQSAPGPSTNDVIPATYE